MRDVETYAAVLDGVRTRMRGRDPAEIEAELVRALSDDDLFMSPSQVTALAYLYAHPFAPFLHPRRVRRLRRDCLAADPGEEDLRAENAQLRQCLAHEPTVAGASSSRTMQGIRHLVRLEPYTEAEAERVQRLCAPYDVRVAPVRPT